LTAALAAQIQLRVPGTEGGVTDFREIFAFLAIPFMPSWYWMLVVAFIASLGGPYGSGEALVLFGQDFGDLVITLMMHLITLPLAWWMYKKWVAPLKTTILFSGCWFLLILFCYYFFFFFIFAVSKYLIYSVDKSILDLYLAFGLFPLEAITTAVVTTLGVVLIRKTQIHHQEREAYISQLADELGIRKQNEEELRFQSHLLDQIGDLITATDLEGNITYVNESECRVFGRSKEDLIGQNVRDYGEDPERGATQQQIMDETISKGEWFGDVVNRVPGGSEIVLQTHTWLLRDENGKPTGMCGVASDITQQKIVENQLRKEHDLFNTILQTSVTALVAFTWQGTIAFCNRRAEELLELSRKPETGELGFLEGTIITTVDNKPVNFLNHEFLDPLLGSTDSFSNYPIFLHKPDGQMFSFQVNCSAVRDEKNEISMLVFSIEDVTRQLNSDSERTRLEDQLRQSQKMESIGQLAGGIAHDFNNLLLVIAGYAELSLDDMSPDDRNHDYLVEIQKAAGRASNLTRQLLAFSRRQVINPVHLGLNESIREMSKLLRRLIPENITIEFIPGYQLGMVYADPSQFEQILLNLCVNSRDAMPEGGNITIETENVIIDNDFCAKHPWAREGRYVLVSVTDTGCGIPPEVLGQIFEPFFTTKPHGQGTGLGLATVYGVTKQHGGMIHAYSEVGIGTTFKVYLPVAERPAREVGSKINGPIVGGNETILIAEDEDVVRDLASRILERAGYHVIVAEDGEVAMDLFRKHYNEINLVLLDVVMPGMNGRVVFERIRLLKPGIKVLFSSGYTAGGVHTNFVMEQGLEMLSKPYNSEDLLRRIRQVLGSPDIPILDLPT